MSSVQNNYSDPPQAMPSPPSGKSPVVWIFLGVFGCATIPVLLLAALLIPAVSSARGAARRMQCSNNLKMISLALLNYEDTWKSFPPAYTVDEQGNRLHSWRTLILPFLEDPQGLAAYEKIDLSQPWDAPANLFLQDVQISIYKCPESESPVTMTEYVVIVDPTSAFPGVETTAFDQIVDGSSNTIGVIETSPELAVQWMEPRDISIQDALDQRSMPTNHSGGFNATMLDGSVQFFSETITDEVLRSIITIQAGDN